MKESPIINFNNILDDFKINATCINYNKYKHFIYYDLMPEAGFRISKINRLANELALSVKANSKFIVNPILNEGIVRLQTTKGKKDVLHLQDIINKRNNEDFIPISLGEFENGNPVIFDLAKNPHTLIAGSTGSGKSVLLHNFIVNIGSLPNTSLFLFDTKRVEFSRYKKPHFKNIVNVAANLTDSISILEFLINKMNKRYEEMSKLDVSSVQELPNYFSKCVVVIDELADLILTDSDKKFQKLLIELAQKSRAAGIYIIAATQRPSADIVTGLIKANFPARISCKVASKRDSLIILDRSGAEMLEGMGDSIIKNYKFDFKRFQVGFIK